MTKDFQMVDEPRYGSRSEAYAADQTAPGPTLQNEEPAESAARLSLDHMSAAIDRRLTSSWADTEDPLVAELRRKHPEELDAARALVKLHLGSQRQWRLKAQAVRDKHLASIFKKLGLKFSQVMLARQ
jgi:hypothetical protein